MLLSNQLCILHVTEAFCGGVLHSLSQILNRLVAEQVECHLIHGLRPETPANFRSRYATEITFHEWQAGREISPYRDFLALRQLLALIKKINPHVIHTHSAKAGVLVRILAPLIRRPIIYSPRGYPFLQSDASTFHRRFYYGIEWLLGKSVGETVAASPSEMEWSQHLSSRAHLIPNMVDCNHLATLVPPVSSISSAAPSTTRRLRVGSAGRITTQKNFPLFQKIAEQAGTDIEFIWIGGVNHGQRELVEDMPENIRLTGWLDREQAVREMASLDVYIQTSRWEGMPITILEAMAMGKPILATSVVGNRDLVESGHNGFLCDSAEEFVAGLRRLRQDPDLLKTTGVHSYSLAHQQYNSDINFKAWLALYKQVARAV